MALIPIVAAALVGLVIVAGSGGNAAIGEHPDSAGYNDLLAAMEAADLPDDWQVFLAATAYRESKWHNDVGLGPNDAPGRPPWFRDSKAGPKTQANEAKAACRAYEKNFDKWFRNSPYPAARYCFGSGGWFGLLPAYGVISGFKATPELIPQIDPWDVSDPLVSLVMAIGLARGLMNWQQFEEGGGTWLALRIGWGNPSAMDEAQSKLDIRKSFGEQLGILDVPPSFMDRRPSPLTIPKGGHLLELLERREAQAREALGWPEAA